MVAFSGTLAHFYIHVYKPVYEGASLSAVDSTSLVFLGSYGGCFMKTLTVAAQTSWVGLAHAPFLPPPSRCFAEQRQRRTPMLSNLV